MHGSLPALGLGAPRLTHAWTQSVVHTSRTWYSTMIFPQGVISEHRGCPSERISAARSSTAACLSLSAPYSTRRARLPA